MGAMLRQRKSPSFAIIPALLTLLAPLAAGCGDEPTNPSTTGDPPRPPATILISNSLGDDILVMRQDTGEITKTLVAKGAGGLSHPDQLLIGADKALYVSSGEDEATSAILRYDAETGAFKDKFASGGGLSRPYGIAFGSDGKVYVSSFKTDQILRYDASTGAFVDVFATGNGMAGGLNGPNGLLFGADGKLYITTEGTVAGKFPTPPLPSQVLRYDITTKTGEVFVDQPMPSPTGAGYVSFLGLAFGPDCNAGSCDLFVSDYANDVRRFDFTTGALVSTIATNYSGETPSKNNIGSLAFGEGGVLFVLGFNADMATGNPGAVLRFDGSTGDPLPGNNNPGALLVKEDARLKRPIGITTVPAEP